MLTKQIVKACILFAALFAIAAASSQQVARLWFSVDARTIASNGGGTAATLTLTPSSSYVSITCNDTDGCALTMGETGVPSGMIVTIVNLSSNAVTMADSAGVQEVGSSVSLAQYAAVTLLYATDRWVEVSRQ